MGVLYRGLGWRMGLRDVLLHLVLLFLGGGEVWGFSGCFGVGSAGGACFRVGMGIHLDAVVYCRGWGRYTGGVRAWMGWT